jgi:hypothetical protein
MPKKRFQVLEALTAACDDDCVPELRKALQWLWLPAAWLRIAATVAAGAGPGVLLPGASLPHMQANPHCAQ